MIKNYILVVLLTLVGGLMSLSGCLASRAPAVVFDGEKYKFGEVKAGEDVVFTFYFSNPGLSDLILTDVFVSCDCVIVKEFDRLVKPGTKGKVYGLLKTQNLQGGIVRAIRVETNVPKSEPVVLSLEGTVLAPAAPLLDK